MWNYNFYLIILSDINLGTSDIFVWLFLSSDNSVSDKTFLKFYLIILFDVNLATTAEWGKKKNRHKRPLILQSHLYEMSRTDKSVETVSQRWPGAGRGRGGRVTDHGRGVTIRGDEIVPKSESGDGCTTLRNTLQITELHALKEWILRYVTYISIKLSYNIYTIYILYIHIYVYK